MTGRGPTLEENLSKGERRKRSPSRRNGHDRRDRGWVRREGRVRDRRRERNRTLAFNNAGVDQPIAAAADVTEEEWDRISAVNLRGVFLCMRREIPLMLEQGGGAIVNTSSGAGVKGFAGQAAYAAAKHGVIGLTSSAALDYASSGIRVNAVCPATIETEMMDRFTGGTPEGRSSVIAQEPIGRMGMPEEVAEAVAWLCSDAAGFVVGHAMVIDGGLTV